ncbi:MAG: hypothetical protein E7379_00185 [Clostridiales bacterium]|nr:hypothetical protein [Clostridiales bacterium]
MKKKYLLGILFSVFSIVFVSACNSPSNIKANFKQEEYTLSVDGSINFFDEFSASGINTDTITLESSNENILRKEEDSFIAKNSGWAYVIARSGNNILAQAKVNVRYKFSSPQNISISNEGVLTWDHSYVTNSENGQTINAQKYSLSYGLVQEDTTVAYTTAPVITTNSYALPTDIKGNYKIKLQAISTNNLYENSDIIENEVNYGVMGKLENIIVENSLSGGVVKIAWTKKANAKYDIFVEGFLAEDVPVADDAGLSTFSYDFSPYENDDNIRLDFVAKPQLTGSSMPTTTTIYLKRVAKPSINYSNTNGQISLSSVSNTKGYVLQDVNDVSNIIDLGKKTTSSLEDKQEGAYTLKALAIGMGKSGTNYYINGLYSSPITVYKLAKPVVEYKMTENGVLISITPTDIATKYKITYGAETATATDADINSETQKIEKTISLSAANAGLVEISIQAFPQTGATVNVGGENFTEKILKSDVESFAVYKTASIRNLEHSISGKKSTTTFNFNKISNVEHKFELFINDNLISNSFEHTGSIVRFVVDDLSKIASLGNKYTFKVKAYLTDAYGEIISTTATEEKIISILGVATKSESQTNGYFSWNSINGAKYLYEVYETNASGTILNQTPVQTSTITGTTIATKLECGYYKIRVYSIGNNRDLLDAHFEDASKYLEMDFFVTEKIATPTVVFIPGGENNQLEITSTEYAKKYQVSVNRIIDGVGVIAADGSGTYIFNNNFTAVGTYNVEVVVDCGDCPEGKEIHLPSDSASLTVTRIASAAYDEVGDTNDGVKLIKNSYGQITGQQLVVKKADYLKQLEAKRGETTLATTTNGEYFIIDMTSNEFGSNYTITLTNIAQDAVESNYYLNSATTSYSFAKVQTPTNLSYNNGILSFECNDNKIESIYLYITTYKNDLAGYCYILELTEGIGAGTTQIDLQTAINDAIEDNDYFKNAYDSMDYLKVTMQSVANTLSGGVHYLPSTVSAGIEISDLSPVSLAFDQASETLSWTTIEDGLYDIYINGTKVMQNQANTSIALAEITGFDKTILQEITVVAKHSKYFNAKQSNSIKIKQLSCPTSVSIEKDGEKFNLNINFSANNAISKVQIDATDCTYTKGNNFATSEITSAGKKEILLIAGEEAVDGVYYLDSSKVEFTLQTIGNIVLTQEADTIKWNNPSDNIMRYNSLNPYNVILTLVDTDGSITKSEIWTKEEKYISLMELEELFGVDFNDETKDFTLYAQAVFNLSYSLNLTVSGAIGLFEDSAVSNVITLYKLQSITGVNYTAKDSSLITNDEVAKKMNGNVEFSFADKWSSLDNVNFIITIGDTPFTVPARNASITGLYSVKLEGSTWKISIPVQLFSTKTVEIKLQVSRTGSLTSDESTLTVARLDKVAEMNLSQEGVLTVTDSQVGVKYALTINHADGKKTQVFDKDEISAIDITTGHWLGAFGAGDYTILVVAYDEEGNVLPSIQALEYKSHQYEGIKNIDIDEEGRIILTVGADSYTNAVFTAKTTVEGKTYTKTFVPTLMGNTGDGAEYMYYISMKDAVDLFEAELLADGIDVYRGYEFSFTVRDEDGINTAWKTISFVFSGDYDTQDLTPEFKRAGLDEDYIVFTMSEMVETSSIYTKYIASYTTTDEEGNQVIANREKEVSYSTIGIPLSTIQGYWIEGENGGRFSKTNNSSGSEVAKACYAVKLNDVLADLECGQYTIKTYRTAIDGEGNYIQYSTFTLTGYKLCTVKDSDEEGEVSLNVSNGYLLEWQKDNKDLSEKAQQENAYYVVVTDGENTKKFLTNVLVYDLRTCGLEINKEYQVSVVALSTDSTVIASNESRSITISQYGKPSNPTVEQGVLGFDLSATQSESGTLFGDIALSGSAENYQQTITETEIYSSPFSFNIENIAKEKIRIKFTTITAQNAEGKAYYITVKAIDLLLDYEVDGKSYFTLLEEYKATITDEKTSAMIESILASRRGLGTDEYLFDDEGTIIPMGLYEVSFVQVIRENDNDVKFIESVPTSSMRVYLSPGASIELKQEDFNGKELQYTLTVTPNKTATTSDGVTYIETTATKYRMLFRGKTLDYTYKVDFEYDGRVWTGTFDGENINSTSVGLVVETMSLTNHEGVYYFRINMSLLRKAIDKILSASEQEFEIHTEYNVDIYAMSNGDKGVLNGKSGKFTITYQDFDIESMSLDKGVIKLPSTSEGNLIVRYAYATTANTVESFVVEKGETEIDLAPIAKAGELAFITFSLKGNHTYNSMSVESEIYGISNPYKLSKPSVESLNNNLRITYSSADLADEVKNAMGGEISYVVANNSGGSHISNTTTNQIDYQVGEFVEEKNASEFYVYLQGNNGNFKKLVSGDAYFTNSAYYDYQLALVERENLLFDRNGNLLQVIFKSETDSIEAKMLNYRQETVDVFYEVERGSISFDMPLTFTENVFTEDDLLANILYQVTIKYYDKSDDDKTSSPEYVATLYLTQEHLVDGKLWLDGQLVNQAYQKAHSDAPHYDLASFEVTALVANEVGNGGVVAINKKHYSIDGSFKSVDGAYLLRSTTELTLDGTDEKKFAHPNQAKRPTAQGWLTMQDGEIKFITDPEVHKDVTGSEYKDSEIMKMLVLLDEYDVTGSKITGKQYEIQGKLRVTDETEGRVGRFIPDDFTDDVIQYLKGNKFKVSLMTYNDDQLLSLPLEIENVYKMPDIKGNYEIRVKENIGDGGLVTGYTTYIDFSKYFANFKVNNSNTFYSIKMIIDLGDNKSVTVTLTASNPTYDLKNNIESLSIQAQDSQPYGTDNRILLINSDVLDVSVLKTTYEAKVIDGEEQGIISWNEETSGFDWIGGEDGVEYEFFYKLVMSSNTEIGITSNSFYLPKNMGTVKSFLIQARNKSLVDEKGNNVIYLFGESIVSEELNGTVNLFHSGDGSKGNPYLIQTISNNATGVVERTALQQFNAMRLRNYEGVHFKLMENIIITIGENFMPMTEFNANLNGNGKTIEIRAGNLNKMSSDYLAKGILGQEYSFGYYYSMFEKLNKTAVVEKLNIKYTINNNSISSKYMIFAPIAAINEGTIKNVTTISLNINALGGEGDNRAVIAGIAGVNYGNILNCNNDSDFTYTIVQNLSCMTFYAGISAFNETGSAIFNCCNNGNINITSQTYGLNVYVGAITIKNAGGVYACANNGDIAVQGQSSSFKGAYYISGCAIVNNGGTINNSFNKGKLSASNYTSSSISGIVIKIGAGSLQSVADVANNKIAQDCSQNVSSKDCYYLSGVDKPEHLNGYTLSGEVDMTLEVITIYVDGVNYDCSLSITGNSASGYIPKITIK